MSFPSSPRHKRTMNPENAEHDAEAASLLSTKPAKPTPETLTSKRDSRPRILHYLKRPSFKNSSREYELSLVSSCPFKSTSTKSPNPPRESSPPRSYRPTLRQPVTSARRFVALTFFFYDALSLRQNKIAAVLPVACATDIRLGEASLFT